MIDTLLDCIAEARSTRALELVCERAKAREQEIRAELTAAELDIVRVRGDLEEVRRTLARAAELYDRVVSECAAPTAAETVAAPGAVKLHAH